MAASATTTAAARLTVDTQPRALDLRRTTTTPAPPRSATAPIAAPVTVPSEPPRPATGGTPVSGAPLGTAPTWRDVGTGAGVPPRREEGTGAGAEVGRALGAGAGVDVGRALGEETPAAGATPVPAASAGAADATTAAQARTAAVITLLRALLRVLLRMNGFSLIGPRHR